VAINPGIGLSQSQASGDFEGYALFQIEMISLTHKAALGDKESSHLYAAIG